MWRRKKQFLYFLVPLAICLFFCYFTAVNSAYYMLIAIAVSVIIYVMDYKKEKQKVKLIRQIKEKRIDFSYNM